MIETRNIIQLLTYSFTCKYLVCIRDYGVVILIVLTNYIVDGLTIYHIFLQNLCFLSAIIRSNEHRKFTAEEMHILCNM